MKLSDIFFWLIFGITIGYIYSGIEFINFIPEIESACLRVAESAGAGAGIGLPPGAHPPADGSVARLK